MASSDGLAPCDCRVAEQPYPLSIALGDYSYAVSSLPTAPTLAICPVEYHFKTAADSDTPAVMRMEPSPPAHQLHVLRSHAQVPVHRIASVATICFNNS